MLRFLRSRRGHSMQEAEDILQDAFLSLLDYHRRKDLKEIHGGLAWKFLLAKSKDYHRSQKSKKNSYIEQSDTEESVAVHDKQIHESKELKDAIDSCLSQLDEKTHAIMYFRIYEHASSNELAERFELSARQINRIIDKASRQLSSALKKAGFGPEDLS